jgi:hypothetical protein
MPPMVVYAGAAAAICYCSELQDSTRCCSAVGRHDASWHVLAQATLPRFI